MGTLAILLLIAILQPWARRPRTMNYSTHAMQRALNRAVIPSQPTQTLPAPAFATQDKFQQQLNLLEQDISKLEVFQFGSSRSVEDSLRSQISDIDNELMRLEQSQ